MHKRRYNRRTLRTIREESGVLIIQLTHGYETVIDLCDRDVVAFAPNWHARIKVAGKVYAETCLDGRLVKLHRVLLNITDKSTYIDHIDGDGLNNRRSNLRICTNSQNQGNSKKHRDASFSRFKGVSRSRGKYRAAIRHENRFIHIGAFDSEIEAARAYDAALSSLKGEFALTNKKMGLL